MRKIYIPAIAVIIIICCCFSVALLCLLTVGVKNGLDLKNTQYPFLTQKPNLKIFEEEKFYSPEVIVKPVSPGALETLKIKDNNYIPENNLRLLAERLKGIKNIPEIIPDIPKDFQIGDTEKFWVSEDESHKNYQVTAVLQYKGEHIYFWVDQKSNFTKSKLDVLAKAFDEKIYSNNRAFFGSEWSPGVDNDPRLYILYAHGIGGRVAGFFASNDEVSPLANQYSNAHEMFIINSDTTSLNDEFTFGVMAHEFQHMIHWYRDRNEESWLNEGFSELAAFINDYSVGGFDYSFISDPDVQLNDWPNNPNETTPHYGAGFMFANYFLNRFGEETTKKLISEKDNGMNSVDKVFLDLNVKDPISGKLMTADDLFADWAVSNYLKDEKVADGRFFYKNYPDSPKADITTNIKKCPSKLEDNTVRQYGTDYLEISCQGNFTLNFQGSTETKLIPADPHSGQYAFWSNKGDESDMTLTKAFDFSKIKGNINLHYWTWYDTEEDFDYVFVEVSENGTDWKIIKTPSGTEENPSGNSYGWGYNGKTKGWIEEVIDLSAYQGKNIQIRFEYITDAAVNGEGFFLDDISIPAIGYQNDFEKDTGGWDAQGFVRIQNVLPQKYIISLIRKGQGDTTVERIELDSLQNARIPVQIDNNNHTIVLAISGATRYTRAPAPYQIEIIK